MDAAELRVAFIKTQLSRAMVEDDIFKQAASREFRRYVEWWGGSLPEQDRKAICEQLSRLEHPDTMST